jgi:hypothetical protein
VLISGACCGPSSWRPSGLRGLKWLGSGGLAEGRVLGQQWVWCLRGKGAELSGNDVQGSPSIAAVQEALHALVGALVAALLVGGLQVCGVGGCEAVEV